MRGPTSLSTGARFPIDFVIKHKPGRRPPCAIMCVSSPTVQAPLPMRGLGLCPLPPGPPPAAQQRHQGAWETTLLTPEVLTHLVWDVTQALAFLQCAARTEDLLSSLDINLELERLLTQGLGGGKREPRREVVKPLMQQHSTPSDWCCWRGRGLAQAPTFLPFEGESVSSGQGRYKMFISE